MAGMCLGVAVPVSVIRAVDRNRYLPANFRSPKSLVSPSRRTSDIRMYGSEWFPLTPTNDIVRNAGWDSISVPIQSTTA